MDSYYALRQLLLNFSRNIRERYKKIGLEITLIFEPFLNEENFFVLEELKVPVDGQNQGIGSLIMKELIDFCDKNNLTMGVNPTEISNTPIDKLHKFYQSFGFKDNKNNEVSGAVRMIRKPKNMNETVKKENLKGGKADGLTAVDLARKHSLFIGTIEKEIEAGLKIEREHVKDAETAREIVMDHIFEFPDYYTNKEAGLKASEKKLEKAEKTESPLKRLANILRENTGLSVADETPTEITYKIMSNDVVAGELTIKVGQPDLGNDVLEILKFKMDPKYRTFKLAYDTLRGLWPIYKNINKIVLSPADDSITFWTRLGFNRLNNDYYFILRGH